jgi:hypothetical protein
MSTDLMKERITETSPQVYARIGGVLHLIIIVIGFITFHLTDDIIRGMASGRVSNLFGVLILVAWMYATQVLAERRSGYVMILRGSLLGSGMPVLHMMGKGVGGDFAKSSGAFLFVWTLIALGATPLFSVILSARGLWSLQRERWKEQASAA